ncbi:hypothetical protein Goarm_006376 [Gossypium armourianum]|uniref:Zinc knuckle CX2CX4HX4C domain-containing protein n=1 Tax=Gossypium armourianum TaxID=34283 RepID=A0A7J9JHT1_9ROSI|nr:hypothetical protein [Gossypium armourianum]
MGCGEDHIRRKITRDAMYHVLKSLWFTKEDVIFVVLKEGIILVRVFNIPFDYLDKEVAIEVGRSIGEVATIDWHAKDGGWVDYIRLGVKIDVLKPLRRAVHLVDRDGTEIICAINYERLLVFSYICSLIGHLTKKCNRKEEQIDANNQSFQYGKWLKVQIGGQTQTRGN